MQMDDKKISWAEPVEVMGAPRIILVNPNPDREYEDTVGGKIFKFPPFKRFSVDARVALELLSNAQARKLDSEMQAEGELQDYYMMMAHENELMHHRAKRMCNPETGKPPRTKPWQIVPLVNLNDPNGQKEFEKGVNLAVQAGYEIEQEEMEQSFRELPLPKLSWDKKDLVKFLEEYGGSGAYAEPGERLLNKALRLFRAHYTQREQDGFGVIDSETGHVVRREDLGMEPKPEETEGAEN